MNTPLLSIVSKRLSELLTSDWTEKDFCDILTEKMMFDIAYEQVINADTYFRDRLVEIGFFIDEDISCKLSTENGTMWYLKGSKGTLELNIEDVIEQLNIV